MSDEQLQLESDNPSNSLITAAIVVTVLVVGVLVVGVDQFFKFAVRDEIASKQLRPVDPRLQALRAEEKGKLSRYQWVDQSGGVVRIPIERAVELTAAEWAQRPAGAAVPVVPVDGAIPAPAADGAAAPTAPPTSPPPAP